MPYAFASGIYNALSSIHKGNHQSLNDANDFIKVVNASISYQVNENGMATKWQEIKYFY